MDNTTRFSNRVNDYVKYRPHYPKEVLTQLENEYQLTNKMLVADIGAGTGISAELFLQNGYKVWGIEPNKEMREESIVQLQAYPNFKAISGTAEDTTIPDESIDIIVTGQAFHWFDPEKAYDEFKRIIKPGGLVTLMWNERLIETDFEKEYEDLIITHGDNYKVIDHRNIDLSTIKKFFNGAEVKLHSFKNKQIFDFNGLKGRLLSSSYMPAYNAPGYDALIIALAQLFNKYEVHGQITIHYTTKMYSGKL